MTVAPIAFASWRAKIETPPVPSTSTTSPALSPPSTTRARQAVSPAVVSVAASAWLKPSRCPGEPGRRPHHDLAGVAVDPIAGHGREVGDRGRAVLPAREEAGDDVVAGLELGHALAHRLDHAGAVGHRDAPVRRRHPSAHDAIVVVVERARVEPDPDLAGARGAGIGHVDQLQPVEPAGRAEYDALHVRPRSLCDYPRCRCARRNVVLSRASRDARSRAASASAVTAG